MTTSSPSPRVALAMAGMRPMLKADRAKPARPESAWRRADQPAAQRRLR
jgi:hypothetical protein